MKMTTEGARALAKLITDTLDDPNLSADHVEYVFLDDMIPGVIHVDFDALYGHLAYDVDRETGETAQVNFGTSSVRLAHTPSSYTEASPQDGVWVGYDTDSHCALIAAGWTIGGDDGQRFYLVPPASLEAIQAYHDRNLAANDGDFINKRDS